MLLTEMLPTFGEEVREALVAMGHAELATQVRQLEVTFRCRCGDAFCTSFSTGPPPEGAWPADHQNIPLDIDHGMVILDVVNGEIRFVEVLDRPELRADLQSVPPAPPREDGSSDSED